MGYSVIERFRSRAGGIRTHTHLIKSQGCCRYTTTLWLVVCERLHRRTVDIFVLLLVRKRFRKW